MAGKSDLVVDPSSPHPFKAFGTVGISDEVLVSVQFRRNGRVDCKCEDRKLGRLLYSIQGSVSWDHSCDLVDNKSVQLAKIAKRNTQGHEFKVKSADGDSRYFNLAPLLRPPEGEPHKRYLSGFTAYYKETPRFLVALRGLVLGQRDEFEFREMATFTQIATCRLVVGEIRKWQEKQVFAVAMSPGQDVALCCLLAFAVSTMARKADLFDD